MKPLQLFTLFMATALFAISANAQEPTPTPTLVRFAFACSGGTDPDSLVINGDFESEVGTVGQVPPGFSGGNSGLSGTLQRQVFNNRLQQFAELRSGASLSTNPQPNQGQDRLATNFFILRFCAVVNGGDLTVEFENFSITLESGTRTQFESSPIRADLGSAGAAEQTPITFTFFGDGVAVIDNVELIPDRRPGGDETPEPSPTPEMPSPTPSGTPGPSPTPTPTLVPGQPTWTPTPALSAQSVQVVADPPMLVLSSNDFNTGSNPKKQILLDVKVIGSNGEEIAVTDIDEDATIQFTIDTRGEFQNAGRLLERLEGGTERTLQTQRRPMNDLEQVIFVPGKAFDGTVRVIVDIEFEGEVDGSREMQEIRGVVPIVFRTDKSASLTGGAGSFNLRNALNQGRKPGDRGFRPDQKTNLFFRELFN